MDKAISNGYTGVFTDCSPSWLKKDENLELLHSENLEKIVRFFVIHSISENQSARTYSIFDDYQWKSWGDTLLTQKLDQQFGKCFKAVSSKEFEELAKEFDLLDDMFHKDTNQRILYVRKEGKYKGFFLHIRNAIAHGRFGIFKSAENKNVYVFEDGRKKNKKFNVNARIVIEQDVLMEIIRIIQEDANKEYNAVLQAIKDGKKTKREILGQLMLEDKVYERVIKLLKQDGKIERKDNKWECIDV